MTVNLVPVLCPSLPTTFRPPVAMSPIVSMDISVWNVRPAILAIGVIDVMTVIMETLWFREGFASPVIVGPILTDQLPTFVTT